MIRKLLCATGAPLLTLSLAAAHLPARAVDLVEFTFGNGVGTTEAQAIAAHLAATPVTGRKQDGSVAPHSFVDLGGGNMGMQLHKSDGGYWFDFTLSANPGYAFQVTNAHFAFKLQNSAGGNRHIGVKPNGEPAVTWYDAAGGDITVTDLGPGDFG